MTADIIFRNKMLHLSEGAIHLVSIEILRYLTKLATATSQQEENWRKGVTETCRLNLEGRGYGLSDLDLHNHAATDFGLQMMRDLLDGILKQYESEATISKTVLNSFCSEATTYTKDVPVGFAKESLMRIAQLLKETCGSNDAKHQDYKGGRTDGI
jgi:hypothetical protein